MLDPGGASPQETCTEARPLTFRVLGLFYELVFKGLKGPESSESKVPTPRFPKFQETPPPMEPFYRGTAPRETVGLKAA